MKYGGDQGNDFYINRPRVNMNGGNPMGGGGPAPGGFAPGPGPGPMAGGGGPMPPGGGPIPGAGPMPGGGPMPGRTPGGSIRNNLGSGFKAKGIFQKDGKINNSRGGLFGSGGGKMGVGPFGFLGNSGGGVNQPRQLVLEASQPGLLANGVATISPDNVFTCIANLPAPNTLTGQGYGTYATYLFDGKGQTGFLAGILRPVGNGAYQTQFRSQVPLAYYSQVIITLENPQSLGHVPQGPVILQNKQPLAPVRFLQPIKKVGGPIKKAGGTVWDKVSGFVKGRMKGGAAIPQVPQVPQGGDILEEAIEPMAQMEQMGPALEELGEIPPIYPKE